MAGADPPSAQTALPKPPVLAVRQLSKTYGSGASAVQALRQVSLEVQGGEFVVLLGPSGSGKSTLLNIMGGLDAPSSGELWFGQQALGQASDAQLTQYRRAHVGFVFQFYNLIPSLTVFENVELVSDIADSPMPVLDALQRVALQARRNHYPAQLSGGEQQRVAIARAVVKRPQLLLCDEPTGALDYATGRLVLEVIAEVGAALGTTVVVITHNTAIAGMADRVVRLADGRIASIEHNAQRLTPAQLSW